MVIMDAYYSSDPLIEIWRNIDQLHMSYLEMEESSHKIEHRNKLEDCIRDYLCIANRNQKFNFQETAEVLNRSANNKKDFSAYKAVTGWNAIQLYAGNLLSQPWRKEYRTVKTYCGFYKHQIEANLVGAEMMFEAMGYKHEGDGILVIEGPICPDRVTDVSKDCLIAYVECQIIKTIWEKISQSFTITWLDVLNFRKTHAYSPEQSIRYLSYQLEQKQYQEQHTRSYPHGSLDQFNRRYQNSSPILPSNHSFPPLNAHVSLPPAPLPPPQYCCASNGCYATYMPHSYHPYHVPIGYNHHQAISKPTYTTNGYYCTNGYCTVPTGQLIELESHNNSLDAVDRPVNHYQRKNSRSSPPPPPPPQEFREVAAENNVSSGTTARNRESPQYEDWDYVYRDLESRGYSKDIGERGDILSPTASEKRRKTKPTDLDDQMRTLKVQDCPLPQMTESELNRRKLDKKIIRPERIPSQSSSYDNASDKIKTSKAIKILNNVVVVEEATKKNPNLLTINNNNNNITAVDNKDKWQCKACTYLNDNSKEICDICSKTRSNVEPLMEIGGAECSKCTLVNPKDKKTCEACGASLMNSPTYI